MNKNRFIKELSKQTGYDEEKINGNLLKFLRII